MIGCDVILEEDIRKAMDCLGIDYMPSRGDLESINMGWLSTRIQRYGGFRKIADEIGIMNKKSLYTELPARKAIPSKWSPEIAKAEIIRVKNEIGIDRMPTRNEIMSHENNNALCAYISRSYGYYGYAELLGLSIKESETTIGKECEQKIVERLRRNGHEVNRMTQNYPYDILVDKCLKIDVKYGNLYHAKSGNFYRFSWGKKYPTCDIYVLVSALNNSSEKQTFRIIPSCHIDNVSGISIGEINSVYDVYIDRWDYIDKYISFYNEILHKQERPA